MVPQTPIAVGVAEAVRLTGISRTTLYEMISDGRLPSLRIGRRRLILSEDLERVLTDARDGAA